MNAFKLAKRAIASGTLFGTVWRQSKAVWAGIRASVSWGFAALKDLVRASICPQAFGFMDGTTLAGALGDAVGVAVAVGAGVDDGVPVGACGAASTAANITEIAARNHFILSKTLQTSRDPASK
jgi:hypothetical protein